MADYSPMMKQYFEVKEKYPNTLLFLSPWGTFTRCSLTMRKFASRELELTLTGRDCGQEERAPMCGVPFHSAETYIARLVAKGYKVAICEQMEDPALANGHRKAQALSASSRPAPLWKAACSTRREQLHRFRVLSG